MLCVPLLHRSITKNFWPSIGRGKEFPSAQQAHDQLEASYRRELAELFDVFGKFDAFDPFQVFSAFDWFAVSPFELR